VESGGILVGLWDITAPAENNYSFSIPADFGVEPENNDVPYK